MLNRRDFLKAGTGLIASAFFQYSHAEGRQLIKRCDIGNNYELLINHIYSVIQKISHKNSRIEQADALAVFCAKRGYSRKAVEILNESMKLAQKSSPTAAHYSLRESAKAYCYINEYALAHKALSDARQNLFNENKECYNGAAIAHIEYYFYADVIEVVRILIKKNNKDMALSLLEDTIKYSSDGLLFPADNQISRLLAEAYCDLGLHNKAEEIADRIIAEYSVYNGYVSYSDRNKIDALAYIAGSYADIGRSDRAYELLDKISRLSKTKNREMITAYARLREWEKAMSLVKEDEFVLIDCPYIIIARQAALSKRYDAAEMALNGAIKAVEEHDYFGLTRVYLLIKTAYIFLSIGRADKAVRLLNRASELLSANKEDSYPQDNADILAKIAIVWIKTGDNSKGMKLLHESFEDIITMEDAFQKSEALSRIAKAYIDNNIAIKEKEAEILNKITAS